MQKTKRILAFLLVVALTVTQLPVMALATSAGEGGEIIAFETLPEETANQTVTLGTSLEDLNLPNTLIATVRVVAEADTEAPEPDNETVRDSGEPQQEETSAPVADAGSGGENKPELDEGQPGPIAGGEQPEPELDKSEQVPAEPETIEINTPIPVKWVSSPDYDGEKAGAYTFTAEIEGFTVSIAPPSISVTVGEITGTVTTFEELPDEIRWQNTAAPQFPAELAGTVSGKAVQIPVIWETEQDYDEKSPERGLYVFDAVPGEDYTLAGGVEAPRITLYIPETVARLALFRMGGGGTDTSPLEITTAAQLVEIAELVNGGRLESFLFNDSSAAVHLELKNDLDLSVYGQGYNGGKGWKPIGTVANPFKGQFDGGEHTIDGLYINNDTLSNAGLFGSVEGGMVQGLALSDVSIRGANETGGIAGRIKNATVEKCGVTGSVNGNATVGGVVGILLDNANIRNSYSAGSVTGTDMSVGGIAGKLNLSMVRNCYSTAVVEGYRLVGGIVGHVELSGIYCIRDCAALNPSVNANGGDVRRVVADPYDTYNYLGNVAFSGMLVSGNTIISKNGSALDGMDITAYDIKTQSTIGGRFTGTSGWTIAPGKLPGLFGETVAMPDYITGGSDDNFPGEGTVANPYLIGTAEKLAKLAELVNDSATNTTYGGSGIHYKLTADIDLSGYGASNTDFNGGKGWVPIGTSTLPFEGYFDGNGKTVTGLTINDSTLDNAGLFGKAMAGIHDLQMTAVQITARDSVGAVVGSITSDPGHSHASLKRCSVSGSVEGGSWVGGAAGSTAVTIKDCFTVCQVTGSDSVGGVVGLVQPGGIVDACYTTGAISVNVANSRGGGIAGQASSGGTVKNCLALNPSVTGVNNIVRFSRVAGDMPGYGGIYCDNTAFDGMTVTAGSDTKTPANDSKSSDGGSKTADQLQMYDGIPYYLFQYPWTYEPGRLPGLFDRTEAMPAHITAKLTSASYFAGGDGSQDDPYQIATATQLAKLAELVNDPVTNAQYGGENVYYKLMNDLDLSGYGASNTSFNDGKGWIPIGDCPPGSSTIFNGSFDGNHHTITGLYINDSAKTRVGLFGYIYDGTVENLGLTNVKITGDESVGGIAGIMSGKIESCYVSGTVVGTWYVGGVVGSISNDGSVQNCYSTGSVVGTQYVGGIAGYVYGSLQNCYSTGSASASAYHVGGIAGTVKSSGTIKNCAALNPKVSAGAEVGRVAGSVDSGGTLAGNRAFSGMIGGGSDKTVTGLDGANMTAEQINAAEFWYTDTNWDSTASWVNPAWNFQDGYLPLLKDFGPGQSGDGGLYLTERDIANAVVNVGGPYTYTGSAIEPSLMVTFDGVTLIKDKDYTVAITSTDDTGNFTSAGTNAGEVTITLTGKGNFCGTTTEYYTIAPKTPTAADLTYDLTAKTYNGLAQPLSVIAKTAGLGAITVKYDGSATAPKDAKTYAATVSIAEGTNYASTTADISLGNYIIDKAALTIIGCTIAVKTYDGTKDASVVGVSFDGVQNGEGFTAATDYTVTNAQFDSADAGANKTITGTVSLTNTARANNYSLANGSLSVHGQTIGKAAAPAIPNISKNVIYDDTANQTADIAEKVAPFKRTGDAPTYLVGTVGGTNPGIILNPSINSAGMLTFACNGGTVGNMATIPVTVSGLGNYNDITVNVTVILTDKIPVTVNLSVPGKTYDGSAATATASAPGIPSGDFTYTWMDSNGTALNPNAAPKNAGSYRVKAVISGDSAKTYAGEKIVSFAIDKVNIIIRANNKSAYVGDAVPVFGTSDYTVVGLAAGEVLKTAPVLAYAATPNMRQTGTYSINASGAAAPDGGNYNEIIYVPGTLSISAKSSGDSGGNSGGSSSGSDTTTTTPGKTPDQPVTVTAPVTATAGAGDSASASIPDKVITDAIAKAQAEAKKQGKTANGISVVLNIIMPKGSTSLTAMLTQNTLNSLVSVGVSQLELDGAPASLGLDLKALQEIQKQSSGDISITIAPATGLSKEAKGLLGNRPVYSITISYVKDGKTVNITSLGSGTATLSIPYAPGKNEAVGYLFGVYVDAKGKANRIPGSAYDANSGSLLIPTSHFSVYGVGYTAPSSKFSDIGHHWGKEAIDYVVGRGLLSGTSATTFAPNTAMTRGMLVTALGRLAGVDSKAYTTNSFTDVKADSAFRPYIEWAYKKGIVQGIGNQQFAPDRAITREEIAVIFANYAKATGYKLPVTREATAYADASSIGSVYKTAVTAMQQAGIMMGGTGNRFNPKSNATRAEVSSMLHRYIKLTIDPATAQGWAKNDAGQWLYYRDGKPVTGTQTIDGAKYFFETTGVLKTGWVKDGDNWRYYSGNKAAMGWLDISDKRYYFTKDGLMVSGKWLQIDGKWYYFYADGALAKSTKVDGYEVDENGVRKTK